MINRQKGMEGRPVAIHVKIPFELRGNKSESDIEVPAGTLREIVNRVAVICPGFAQYVLATPDSLRSSTTVFLDDREFGARLDARVPDGARLEMIRMIAGG
jgi:hypothetical protein